MQKHGNKPQEQPYWFECSEKNLWHANVWMCNEEVEIYIRCTKYRYGWWIENTHEKRLMGSFSTRWSSFFLAASEAKEYLAKERDGLCVHKGLRDVDHN